MGKRIKWLDRKLVQKLEALYNEDWEVVEDYEKFETIEEGEWVQDYKYQYKEVVVKFDDEFYQLNFSRSGSYHTDWYYNDTEGLKVSRQEKVVTQTIVTWEAVEFTE